MAKKVIRETFLPRMIPVIWYTLVTKLVNKSTTHTHTPKLPDYSSEVDQLMLDCSHV